MDQIPESPRRVGVCDTWGAGACLHHETGLGESRGGREGLWEEEAQEGRPVPPVCVSVLSLLLFWPPIPLFFLSLSSIFPSFTLGSHMHRCYGCSSSPVATQSRRPPLTPRPLIHPLPTNPQPRTLPMAQVSPILASLHFTLLLPYLGLKTPPAAESLQSPQVALLESLGGNLCQPTGDADVLSLAVHPEGPCELSPGVTAGWQEQQHPHGIRWAEAPQGDTHHSAEWDQESALYSARTRDTCKRHGEEEPFKRFTELRTGLAWGH